MVLWGKPYKHFKTIPKNNNDTGEKSINIHKVCTIHKKSLKVLSDNLSCKMIVCRNDNWGKPHLHFAN